MSTNISIPFNKPYLTGREMDYMQEAASRGHLSGNGYFTKKCQHFFEKKYGFKKCFLTTSCTDALEMAAILADIRPSDEVIMPSFTFVSTANAFVLRGAKIVFCDSRADHPGMDESLIEGLITARTKVIVPVHYAGVACDMDVIMGIAEKYGLLVIEDAAQAIHSFYIGADGISHALGGIGHMAAFSFHETKNIISGEGGMLVVNDDRFAKRAEIIWEKGTNRAAFFRGDVDKYGWIDVGSSFLPSELIAAFLWAQLENLLHIQEARKSLWSRYTEQLRILEEQDRFRLPRIPNYASNNAHMFYMILPSLDKRTRFIDKLRREGILAVFHYQGLHKSAFQKTSLPAVELPQTDLYSDQLVRIPFYIGLDQEQVIEKIRNHNGA